MKTEQKYRLPMTTQPDKFPVLLISHDGKELVPCFGDTAFKIAASSGLYSGYQYLEILPAAPRAKTREEADDEAFRDFLTSQNVQDPYDNAFETEKQSFHAALSYERQRIREMWAWQDVGEIADAADLIEKFKMPRYAAFLRELAEEVKE